MEMDAPEPARPVAPVPKWLPSGPSSVPPEDEDEKEWSDSVKQEPDDKLDKQGQGWQGQGRQQSSGKGKAGKKAGNKASFKKGKAGNKASFKKGKATAGKQKTVIGLAPPPRV